MKSLLGKKLRQLRLSAGFSFDELELKTKISVQHLRNLEKGKFEHLPAPVFVRGFLQKWARATNGNANELQYMYAQNTHSKPPQHKFESISFRTFHLPSLRYFFVVLCVGCAVALFSYIYYTQFIAARDPQVQITYPLDVDSVSLTQEVRIQGNTQNVDHLTVNNTPVALNHNGAFLHFYTLEQGLNTVSFIATNQKGEQVKIIRNILYGG